MNRKWIMAGSCAVLSVAAVIAVLVSWHFVLGPLWLTRVHGSEMADTILGFEETAWSQETCLNPALLENVAVGAELEAQQSFLSRSNTCYVFEQPSVRITTVSEYKPTCAKVVAESWHQYQYQVDLGALEVITGTEQVSQSSESMDRSVYILLREDSEASWKVAYRYILSSYMRTHEWLEIPNCSNVPATYPTDK